ncbi:MAG TPA: siderophore-interacting protein, partial [Acidimicrobiales bacterium]|nr:siderophore-interacting protein [Acidimicrobiales bacterium]
MRADPPPSDGGGRPRRPPPPFRRAVVARRRVLGPRLVRVTVAGAELEGFPVPEPAASVRLLLPSPGAALVVPSWTGNEFLLPDGRRPVIRTLTPRRVDPGRGELDVDVVVHGEGAASRWAHEARAGQPVAVSGPGRGTALDPGARAAVVAGDETALTAVAQVLEALPETTPVVVLVETVRVGAGEPAPPLPARPGAEVRWLPRHPA